MSDPKTQDPGDVRPVYQAALRLPIVEVLNIPVQTVWLTLADPEVGHLGPPKGKNGGFL